jgi:DNA-directed RNA polymerase alpha subunit
MSPLTCPHCKAQLDLGCTMTLTIHSPPGEPWRHTPLEDMELSVRAHNVLHNRGYQTAGEVDDTPDSELLRSNNFGKVSLREVREELARLKAIPQEAHR